jgi:transaldolase
MHTVDHRDGSLLELTVEAPVDPARLTVKVFADGADVDGIRELCANPLIKGFTTNPTLMRKSGVTDYERFARELLDAVPELPISFEVFADDPRGMVREARRIADWGDNVYVKVPVTDCAGRRTERVIRRLCADGVRVNVTGLLTLEQVQWVSACIGDGAQACVSVFAGRVADTGVDPMPLMAAALDVVEEHPGIELIWASPRELFNVVQADRIGCHIITVTHDLLKKLPLLGRNLAEYSLDTVRMFRRDAVAAGYTL